MAEKFDPKETVSFEELLMSEVLTMEALINLLEREGLIRVGFNGKFLSVIKDNCFAVRAR